MTLDWTDWAQRHIGTQKYFSESPGLTVEAARWIVERRPKAVVCDFFEEPAARRPGWRADPDHDGERRPRLAPDHFLALFTASVYGRGTALNLAVESPRYDNYEFGQAPLLETVATLNNDDGSLTIFAVNRAQEGPLPLEGDVRSFVGHEVVEHLVLEHKDPKATNTAKHPNSVMPHKGGAPPCWTAS